MDIIWHGHSCFSLKGKDATIVTDPFKLGAELPKLKADIVTLSGEGKTEEVEGDPKILDWPGEFEVSDVAIVSLAPNGGESNIFTFALDGIRICHLGYLSHEISDEVIDQIGDVDVLLLPVGGEIVLDGKLAQKVMEAIEPRVVIPMLYSASASDLKLSGAEEFLKAVGKTELEARDKYTIGARSALPDGNMEFILLTPKLA
ncbi:MBL fold metallo-hydrolase [Candidatus Peregrinibacteria bacterium]|nr:MAG: MBL fold metallo-hydrolase [Candidatus Peregrinibacteria bacterium]